MLIHIYMYTHIQICAQKQTHTYRQAHIYKHVHAHLSTQQIQTLTHTYKKNSNSLLHSFIHSLIKCSFQHIYLHKLKSFTYIIETQFIQSLPQVK